MTVARGDGIGPEIMEATLSILEAADARLALEEVEVGAAAYRRGMSSGVPPSVWESLRRTKVLLKAPVTTPEAGGYKSVNVTIRKALGLFANVRPCPTYAPFVSTAHPDMDLVVIRENEEDLYAGIEHRQTADVVQCLKLISRPGTERLIRYAFEYARRHGRQRVSCFTKDNIMKLTDGLFHAIFEEVASEYPELEAAHSIVDIGTARLAADPSAFDVVVLPNLYGDIISDVAAELAGSVGMAASANLGAGLAMFEAIHGSAPLLAGRDLANPSGLLLAAVQMLVHLGEAQTATLVHNAWLRTVEDGIHTADMYDPQCSRARVGTRDFASSVICRLGQAPRQLKAAIYPDQLGPIQVEVRPRARPVKSQVGIDVFVEWVGSIEDLAGRLEAAAGTGLRLAMITNRGQKVYPDGLAETYCVDHWRCRFQPPDPGRELTTGDAVGLLSRLGDLGLEFIKTEGLFTFDGVPGYSLGQGQ